jgi:hypothetical protein
MTPLFSSQSSSSSSRLSIILLRFQQNKGEVSVHGEALNHISRLHIRRATSTPLTAPLPHHLMFTTRHGVTGICCQTEACIAEWASPSAAVNRRSVQQEAWGCSQAGPHRRIAVIRSSA